MLSLIAPVYNEQECIRAFAQAVDEAVGGAGIEYELVFVDDGSTDRSWEEMSGLAKGDPRIRAVRLSRNFGKEGAMFAGLDAAEGDRVCILDCDLQHPPATVVEMMRRMDQTSADIVQAVKSSRGRESALYRAAMRGFYGLLKVMSGIDLYNAADFKLLSRKALSALDAMPERLTFFRAMSSWVGFYTETVEFSVSPRHSGRSRFSSWKLLKYGFGSIASFSAVPMQLVTLMGALFILGGLVVGIISIVQRIQGTAFVGFTTVILLLLISGGAIMLSLGIIGFYIARIYEEIKQRPRYIVSETERMK